MATPTLSDLLERNASYASKMQPLPLLSEMASLGMQPRTTIVVTCADPRICPELFFGFEPGEGVVFRNAGGHVRPALTDILTLDSFFGHGHLNQLLIVHHTDCGASHFKNNAVKDEIISRHPNRKAEVEKLEVGSFEHRSIAESVLEDMEFVQKEALLGEALKKGTRGFVFDIKTGILTEVGQ